MLSRLLYGSETWSLPRPQERRLEVFFNKCVRMIAGYNHLKLRITGTTDAQLRARLGIPPLRALLDRSLLRWLGHVFRMTRDRLPLQLISAAVDDWGGMNPKHGYHLSVRQALNAYSIHELDVARLAQDRKAWRSRIHGVWTDPRKADFVPPPPSVTEHAPGSWRCNVCAYDSKCGQPVNATGIGQHFASQHIRPHMRPPRRRSPSPPSSTTLSSPRSFRDRSCSSSRVVCSSPSSSSISAPARSPRPHSTAPT